MAKKKVLFVATVDSHIELFHLPFLKMFKDRGYEVHVATDTDKPIEYCDKKICLPIKRSPFKFVSNYKAVRQLKKVMNKEGYDIVHCHTPMGGVVARMAGKRARRNGTRMIYTAHGFHFYKGAPVHYWLMFYPVEWYLAKFTDTLITINNEDFERAKRKFSKRCRDVQYVPGVGVDPKKFEKKLSEKDKLALRKKLGIAPDDKVLICVGRLDKNKNQGFLIKVLKELLAEDDKYRLLLVGPDDLNGKYQKLAYRLNIKEKVDFLGFRNDIAELMRIADIAMSASKREGLPVNLIESVMMGLPIVALSCRGVEELLGTDSFSAIIKKMNIKDFKKAIINLDIKSVKKNNIQCEEYSLTKIKEKMKYIYCLSKKMPIRILHVIGCMGYGGAENFLMNIYRSINKDNIQFDFLVNRTGAFDDEISRMGGRIYMIPALQKVGEAAYKNELMHFFHCYKNEYNIVHSHINQVSGLILECARKSGIPVRIAHSHGSSSSNNVLVRLYKNHLGNKIPNNATHLFACSDLAARYMFPKNYKKAIIIKNGINMNRFLFDEKKRRTMRKKYNISKECFIVGHVGRFIVQKNHIFLLDVFNELSYFYKDSRLFLIGAGPEEKNIRSKIKKMGIADKVIFIGNTSDTSIYYSAFDCFIFPSLSEGLPLSLIEAQANGLPCLASDSISKEVRISDGLEFMSLDESAKNWAKHVFVMPKKRIVNIGQDFNVLDACEKLCKFYLEVSHNED